MSAHRRIGVLRYWRPCVGASAYQRVDVLAATCRRIGVSACWRIDFHAVVVILLIGQDKLTAAGPEEALRGQGFVGETSPWPKGMYAKGDKLQYWRSPFNLLQRHA